MAKKHKAWWIDDKEQVIPLKYADDRKIKGTHGYKYGELIGDADIPDPFEVDDPDAAINWVIDKVDQAFSNNWVRVRDYGDELSIDAKKFVKPQLVSKLLSIAGIDDTYNVIVESRENDKRYQGPASGYSLWYKQKVNGIDPNIIKRIMELQKFR